MFHEKVTLMKKKKSKGEPRVDLYNSKSFECTRKVEFLPKFEGGLLDVATVDVAGVAVAG